VFPKLKPEVVDEFVESSDFDPKTNPAEEDFPKVPEKPVFSVELFSVSEDPKNPEGGFFLFSIGFV